MGTKLTALDPLQYGGARGPGKAGRVAAGAGFDLMAAILAVLIALTSLLLPQ